MLPRAILANIFLISHILLLFHSLKGSSNKLQNMRNSENISYIALGTVRQQLHISFVKTDQKTLTVKIDCVVT